LRCTTSLDVTATGYARRGVHVSFKEFPAARSFTDDWIAVELVVANRDLHAQVTNKTNAPMTVEGVVVHPDDLRRTVARETIEPLSDLSVRLVSLGEIGKDPDTANDILRLEVRFTVGREECGYDFRVGAGVV
jgi:hypothetical protein